MSTQRSADDARSGVAARAITIGAIAIAAALALPATAYAQDDGDDDSAIGQDLRRYWSGEREMPVIGGEKLFVTEGRVEIALHGGVLPNDAYYNYFPVGLNVAYSFDGIWGLELAASYVGLTMDSELTDFLEQNGASIDKAVDLSDKQVLRTDLVATFSPLYGKWSFQTYKISHFDLFFALGGGIVVVEEPEILASGDPAAEPVTKVLPEGLVGIGTRFFLTDWMDLRVDARWYFYPRFAGTSEDADKRTLGAPAQITLGIGFLTPEL